ncbi:MAG: hypothetical protein MJZ65_02075 [Paludibacteraceae bacterium]|nr:hypothetical protein [Paludibacteraceae bacterium]
MKKLFISLLMIAATLNVMATSSVTIHILDNEAWESDMYLTESTEGTLTAEVEPGNSIALYAVYNSKKCEQLRLETLGELPIGFKIQATTATMTVTDASGAPLYMKNLADGTITELAKDAVINITIASDKVNTWVEDMYQLCAAPVENYYPREVASDNWGTICYPELITSVEGAVVYELAGRNADATKIAVVPVAAADMVAGKPYIFNATADAQKFFYNPDVTATLQEGACGLTGTFGQTTLGTDGYYVVKGQSFVPALGTSTVLANRAYLALTDISAMDEYVPTSGVSARFFSVVRGAATEDMQVAADGVKDGSYLINGRLVIVKDGKMFNVLGL